MVWENENTALPRKPPMAHQTKFLLEAPTAPLRAQKAKAQPDLWRGSDAGKGGRRREEEEEHHLLWR